MKRRFRFLLMIALVLAANGAAFPFGGENPLGPGENIHIAAERKNWHHQDIAYDALIAAGFQPGPAATGQGAAESITWHADYIDSYLYNPLFWAPGGINRFKVALATEPELLKLHFDDNFSLPAVQAAFRKYATGTLAGLVWAKERNDVAAAHNVLGVSLHAVADFYAHSNWVDDPARRSKTWLDFTLAERNTLPIYIGTYEEPEQLGVKHHGKILPVCTLIGNGLTQAVLEAGCRGVSPFTKATICNHFRECKRATTVNPPIELAGITPPKGLVYTLPGIALDSTWQAPIGYKMRGLKDSNPQEILQTAKTLAKKHSTQWLQILEQQMNKLGAGVFWTQVKTTSSFAQRNAQYENYSKFPYTFLSAGPYPLNPTRGTRAVGSQPVTPFTVAGVGTVGDTTDRPIGGVKVSRLQNNVSSGSTDVTDQPLEAKPFPVQAPAKFRTVDSKPFAVRKSGKGRPPDVPPGGEYYLRVKLKTAADTHSGTDSDIVLHAAGKQFLLDYMPREAALIAYNDFEARDEQVYTVGPFDRIPGDITLENRSANAREVLEAFGKAFVDAVKTIVASIADFFVSLVGGHADFVGQHGIVWEPHELNAIGATPVPFSRTIDAGDDGRYTVHGTIGKFVGFPVGHPFHHFSTYAVNLKTLQCERESKWDRGSNSDEPFLLSILVPHPGSVSQRLSGPYNDVDAGESVTLGQSFITGTIPTVYGRLSLQFQLWESDDESSASRSELLKAFATKADAATDPFERNLNATIGAALAADWKLEHIEVYAFGRGSRVSAGTVLDQRVDAWIEGKTMKSFPLNPAGCRDLGVTADELQTLGAGSPPVGPGMVRPPILRSQAIESESHGLSGRYIIPVLVLIGLVFALASVGISRRSR